MSEIATIDFERQPSGSVRPLLIVPEAIFQSAARDVKTHMKQKKWLTHKPDRLYARLASAQEGVAVRGMNDRVVGRMGSRRAKLGAIEQINAVTGRAFELAGEQDVSQEHPLRVLTYRRTGMEFDAVVDVHPPEAGSEELSWLATRHLARLAYNLKTAEELGVKSGAREATLANYEQHVGSMIDVSPDNIRLSFGDNASFGLTTAAATDRSWRFSAHSLCAGVQPILALTFAAIMARADDLLNPNYPGSTHVALSQVASE